nr:hypothetical protein [Dysgonomonas sp. ZJ709]
MFFFGKLENNLLLIQPPTAEGANKNRTSLKENGVNDRLLHCSDAHSFSEDKIETKPKELGHCYTAKNKTQPKMKVDDNAFEDWVNRLNNRINSMDAKLDKLIDPNNKLENGDLLDNQDLMILIKNESPNITTIKKYRGSSFQKNKSKNLLFKIRCTQSDRKQFR